ncbi:MAG: radical SAM family heme chaperone HemW [Bacteroidales bacterium]|nr:radical SAM family heme chaperone HemW [Bacteroidales bacterium]
MNRTTNTEPPSPFREPPWREPRTAYLHIPFCAHHCGYCDFAVSAGQDHLVELYLEALTLELTTLGQPRPVETRFIGGGTPTYLTPPQLERLLQAITHWLPLIEDTGEFSIESTPESLNPEKVAVLAQYGVNRVSLGVQSFQARHLNTLDRQHDPSQIAPAVAAVRQQIPAFSFDLIFGTPGQTLWDWEADLTAALQYAPAHISTYGLTYEKGTPLWKSRQRGQLVALDEDAELAMYEHTMNRLEAAGFEHYEISNFARPGQRSRHNERYWANEAYYGFGVGAARYIDGCRELNVRDTKLYIRRVLAGESPTFQSEELEPRDRAWETIATQLRRCDGITRSRFFLQTGFSLDTLIAAPLPQLIALGLLTDDGSTVRLSRRGRCVADGVIEELLSHQ